MNSSYNNVIKIKSLSYNCGAVEYDPMSIEGPKGFPQGGARDGKIASGDNSSFYKLNEQSVHRLKKVPLTSGKNTFRWSLTQTKNRKMGVFYYYTGLESQCTINPCFF
nr:lytic polysaccharide monooxygenase [Arsenophonus endosymbiont of Bemisia tabaci]